MTQSLRHALLLEIVRALSQHPDLAGVPVLRNPRTQLTLAHGQRAIIVREQADDLMDSAGQTETRRYSVIVGAISRRHDEPDADADALWESTRKAIVAAVPAMTTATNSARVLLREQSTQFDVEPLDSGGAAVLTTWVVQYRRPPTL